MKTFKYLISMLIAIGIALVALVGILQITFANDTNTEPLPDCSDTSVAETIEQKKLTEQSMEEQLSWSAKALPFDNAGSYSEQRNVIVNTALSQVSGKEPVQDNVNIYEKWFSETYSEKSLDYGLSGWNTVFIQWCAHNAGLSFPVVANSENLLEALVADGHTAHPITEYDSSVAYPRRFSCGDIVFVPVIGDDDIVFDYYIGIVVGADYSEVSVVFGNMDNRVEMKRCSLSGIGSTDGDLYAATVIQYRYMTVAEQCFSFFLNEMGLNKAAACAVMANILAESRFQPVKCGDGDYSFGLFQWQFDRRDALMDYCTANSLDPSLAGSQLRYFRHEMETEFSDTLALMKSCADTSDGAAYAADIFCRNYEVPVNAWFRGRERALTASDVIWPRFA